jgi:hypothetical protein
MPSRARSTPPHTTPTVDPGRAHRDGLFCRADVRRLGLSDEVLRWRVRTGVWVRLRRDTYVTAERLAHAHTDPRSLHLLHAAAAFQRSATDDPVLSHRSAAIAHRLPLLHRWPEHPEVTLPRHRRSTLASVIQHTTHAPLSPDDITMLDGIRVTALAKTIVDVASTTTRHEAIVLLDTVLRSGRITLAQVQQVADAALNGRRWRQVHELLKATDRRSPDALTSLARMTLLEHHVAVDEVGVVIGRTSQGEPLRIPLLWNKARVAVVPRGDAQLVRLVQAADMTPIGVDLDTVLHRGAEFAALVDGLIDHERVA